MPISFLRSDIKSLNLDLSEYGENHRSYEGWKVIIRIYFMKSIYFCVRKENVFIMLWSVLKNFTHIWKFINPFNMVCMVFWEPVSNNCFLLFISPFLLINILPASLMLLSCSFQVFEEMSFFLLKCSFITNVIFNTWVIGFVIVTFQMLW